MSLLQKGDTVGFVATSSGLNGKKIDFAIKFWLNFYLVSIGCKIKSSPINISS